MTLSEYLNDNGFELVDIEKDFTVEKGNIRNRNCYLNLNANKKLREMAKTDDFKLLGIWKDVEISFNSDDERKRFVEFCRESNLVKLDDENSALLNMTLESRYNPNKSTGEFGMIIVEGKKLTPVIIKQTQESNKRTFTINRGILE